VALKLDVTSDEDAVAPARAARDVNLLVNNAGIARSGGFLADGAVETARELFEVNFVGPLRMRVHSRLSWRRTAAARSSMCFLLQAG